MQRSLDKELGPAFERSLILNISALRMTSPLHVQSYSRLTILNLLRDDCFPPELQILQFNILFKSQIRSFQIVYCHWKHALLYFLGQDLCLLHYANGPGIFQSMMSGQNMQMTRGWACVKGHLLPTHCFCEQQIAFVDEGFNASLHCFSF